MSRLCADRLLDWCKFLTQQFSSARKCTLLHCCNIVGLYLQHGRWSRITDRIVTHLSSSLRVYSDSMGIVDIVSIDSSAWACMERKKESCEYSLDFLWRAEVQIWHILCYETVRSKKAQGRIQGVTEVTSHPFPWEREKNYITKNIIYNIFYKAKFI